MKKEPGIYKITNLITNHCYIGSSIDVSRRVKAHIYYLSLDKHQNTYLQRSYNKHGKDSFEFTVLEYTTEDALLEREQFYIDNFNPRYNILRIAGSPKGFVHSEKAKAKMSSKRKEFLQTPKGKEAHAKAVEAAKVWDDNRRKKQSIISSGRKQSQETIEKRVSQFRGQKRTEEQKEKMRKAAVGRKVSDEARAKMSESRKGIAKESNRKAIVQLDKEGNIINEFIGLQQAQDDTSISIKSISNCLTGTSKSAGGYVWKYKQ